MMRYLILIIMFLSTAAIAQPLYEEQLIFPLQDKHVHGSSIVQIPNGDLLACWFHGSGERTANDVQVQGARYSQKTGKWGPVFQMADTPNLPDCNPVLFVGPDEKLWLFWVVVQAARWERSLLKYRVSEDYQKEGPPDWKWQDFILFQPGEKFVAAMKAESRRLNGIDPMWSEYAPQYGKMLIEAAQDPVKQESGWMTRIHPIVLKSGRILLPLYSDGYNVSMAAISDDNGRSWRDSCPIIGFGPIQPAFVQRQDGSVAAYMRDSGVAPGRVMYSISEDEGETWRFAEDIDVPNPGSSLEVINLADGRWLMVYNDSEDGRHTLALAISHDEGKTWKRKTYIEKAKPGEGSFAYPSIIQSSDGLIQLSYSYAPGEKKAIKHVRFNLEWLNKSKP